MCGDGRRAELARDGGGDEDPAANDGGRAGERARARPEEGARAVLVGVRRAHLRELRAVGRLRRARGRRAPSPVAAAVSAQPPRKRANEQHARSRLGDASRRGRTGHTQPQRPNHQEWIENKIEQRGDASGAERCARVAHAAEDALGRADGERARQRDRARPDVRERVGLQRRAAVATHEAARPRRRRPAEHDAH